jgi:hypothetical protein
MAAHRPAWQARPNKQLAFRNAPVAQRLFPHCHLELTEYVQRWSGNDFGNVCAHPFDHIREDLWPWLRERQYASPEDDQQLDAFLKRLGRRDAHLRPGIELRCSWPWPHAVHLDERGALATEVRAAVAELLTMLDEPPPPACIACLDRLDFLEDGRMHTRPCPPGAPSRDQAGIKETCVVRPMAQQRQEANS